MAEKARASFGSPAWGATAFALLAAAWLLPLSITWKASPDLGHAWAVPVLMAYLWWERWDARPVAVGRERIGFRVWLLVPLLLAVELFLRLLLTPNPLWPMLLVYYTGTFALAAVIAARLAWGWAGVKWIAGPLLLLISALPIPSFISTAVIIPLREVMAGLAAEICNAVGKPALAAGTSVQLGGGWVGLDEACGGIRSFQACIMLGLFFGEWYRLSWWRRLALLLAGAGAALVGNFARVLFLALRSGAGGAHAVESAHDAAGWVAMGVSLAGTAWLAWRWGGYRWPAQTAVPRAGTPTASRAWIWLGVVALMFALNEGATRTWYAHGEAHRRAVIPQWSVRFPENHWSFHREPLGEIARDMLRPDFFYAGRWQPSREVVASSYYVEWRRGQVARSIPFEHNPSVCLPFAGCEFVRTLDPIVVRKGAYEIPFFAYKFRRAGDDLLVVFVIWDPSRGQVLTRPDITSWRQWWDIRWGDVRDGREHQPAQLLAASLTWRDDPQRRMQEILNEIVILN